MDLLHEDASWPSCTSNCGVANSGENTSRWFVTYFTNTAETQAVMNFLKTNKIVAIPTCFATSAGGTTNTSSTSPTLEDCVSQWTSSYSTFAPYEKYMLVNIANEWGDANGTECAVSQTVWENAYVTAVQNMRKAGITAALVTDAGEAGVDQTCIINHGQNIYNADPQHNIVFSWHEYGFSPSETSSIIQSLAAAQTATAGAYGGFPVIVGEFGPSGVYGGTTTAQEVIQDANAAGLGWNAWAWDDQTQPFGICVEAGNGSAACSNNDFTLLTSGGGAGQPAHCTSPGACTTSPCNCTADSTLSTYGNQVILSPNFGLFYAQPPKATVF